MYNQMLSIMTPSLRPVVMCAWYLLLVLSFSLNITCADANDDGMCGGEGQRDPSSWKWKWRRNKRQRAATHKGKQHLLLGGATSAPSLCIQKWSRSFLQGLLVELEEIVPICMSDCPESHVGGTWKLIPC